MNLNYEMRAVFGLLPPGAVAVNLSQTAAAGAQCQVTMPGVAQRTNFLTGFTVTTGPPASGTVPIVVLVTVTDGTWTLNFELTETISAGGWMRESYPISIPASGLNTPITITLAAAANGGVSAISLEGYYL